VTAWRQGNAGRLATGFLNLFLNAKDAMNGGGTCWSTQNGDSVAVRVSDTGSGIAQGTFNASTTHSLPRKLRR